MRESCGVVGAFTFDDKLLLSQLFEGECALQHRGQEAVGYSILSGNDIKTLASMGLVSESSIFFQPFRGHLGIAHNRYSTTGQNTYKNTQPIERTSEHGVKYSFAFNGNIANYFELRDEIQKEYELQTTSDAEILAILFGRDLGRKDFHDIFKEVAPRINGAYSAVMLVNDQSPKIFAFRDPLGFRPLCIGQSEDGYFAASESVAFAECYMDAKMIGDVSPGEIITIDQNGLQSQKIFDSNKHAHCMFEWVYFSRPESVIENKQVYCVREKLGLLLAEIYKPDADIVIPVPDSGRTAASGFSIRSGIPLKEGLYKDRYVYKRTFIMPGQHERDEAARKKLNPILPIVENKKIVLIDDSIVRGTSMKSYIQKLREAGASKVHVGISCPPLIDWCPYGIDFYAKELVARKYMGRTHPEICSLVGKEFGANSLCYNTLDNLIEAIGPPKDDLCLGCLTGKYPTEVVPKTKEERKR